MLQGLPSLPLGRVKCRLDGVGRLLSRETDHAAQNPLSGHHIKYFTDFSIRFGFGTIGAI
jgi:hypothetical protein